MLDRENSVASLRALIGTMAATLAIAASTLWDYRFFNLRIFDFVALICLLGYLACRTEPIRGFFDRRKDAIILFAVVIAYTLLGLIWHGHRSSAAIITLAFLGFLLVGRRDWIINADLFSWLLAAHITLFLIQFFAFIFFNVMIDFQTIAGSHSRIDQGLAQGIHQIRASGLFQEANSYSLNVFVLGTIAALQRPNLPLITLAAITLALSQSLWGIGAACALLLLYCIRYREAAKPMLLAGLIFASVVNGYLWLNTRNDESMPFVYSRMLRIFNDTSVRERYVINRCPDKIVAENNAVSAGARLGYALLGEGLSTSYFEKCLPANGISFLFKSLGVIGLIFLFAGFAQSLRGLSRRAKLYAIIAVAFSFTSYPLVTYLIFWLWLPAIFVLLRRGEAEIAPAD